MKVIDLTHALHTTIPSWDGGCCFRIHNIVDYNDCSAPNLFRVQDIESKAGAGTHIDAPAHCFPHGIPIDGLQLVNLMTNCIVIHVNDEVDENYVVMPKKIEEFEKLHGRIPSNSFVIFYTGWDVYWDTPENYRNNLIFPSIHEDAAKLLLERDVAGIGIDTLSPDAQGKDFPVHRVILGAGKYIVENIAHAKNLPPTGAKVLILPMKIKDGTEAPIRIVATIV